jgi:hypothetical protein
MDELTAVRQLLADDSPSGPEVATRARARLDSAIAGVGKSRRHPARRTWRLQVAAGLAVVVAAGFIIAEVTAGAPTTPASALTVRELAARAAAAAGRQPEVRPGQWVFWRERLGGPNTEVFHVWMTADAQRAAWVYKGKVISLGKGPFDGPPVVSKSPAGGYGYGYESGKLPVRYGSLRSLPRHPLALDRYLGHLRLRGWGSAPVRAFDVIEVLLTSYVLPPDLTAELYQALGAIPGVRVDNNAVDVAGRHGVGFFSPYQVGGYQEIILNPRSFRLMGTDSYLRYHHELISGIAILKEVLVSAPGLRR